MAKRASKIAMLFSPFTETVRLAENDFKVEPDVTSRVFPSHTFTDGCGFMSSEFASEVQEVLGLDYQPSAVHIRYRGIEGMLILKEDLSGIKVQFHKSMQKFLDPDEEKPDVFNIVNVIGYSRPFTNGYLNSRMIMLLEERGVSAQSLEALQNGYHELLEGINKKTSEYFLMLKGKFHLLQEIQDNGIDGSTRELKRLQKRELEEMEEAGYTRVLVPKSREVFAVCDPFNKLNYGECYFNPTVRGDKGEDFPAGQKFVVMRSQCYHPGDVRVLKMTDKREGYENLKDCLVLPVKGRHPHAFECFGGDLNGKKFFVSWDQSILPSRKEKPCNYSPSVKAKIFTAAARSRLTFSKVTSKLKRTNPSKGVEDRKEMELYFTTYSDQITKEIQQAYMQCAKTSGLSSQNSRHLCKMLYRATIPGEDLQNLQRELNSMEPEILSGKSTGLPIDHEITGKQSTSLAVSLDSSLDEEDDFEERLSLGHNTLSSTTACESSSGDPCQRGIKIWQKLDERAKEFVLRMQHETRKSIV